MVSDGVAAYVVMQAAIGSGGIGRNSPIDCLAYPECGARLRLVLVDWSVRTMARLDSTNALTERYFHHGADCAQTVTVGPRGGVSYPRTELWRRNGATQTWKTRPTDYRVPVKYGMRSYGQLIAADGAPYGPWHVGTAEDCDLGTLRDSIATA